MQKSIINLDNLNKNKKNQLNEITNQTFTPKASYKFNMGSIAVTEACDLSCVFCHFNGPKATKKTQSIDKKYAIKAINELKVGTELYFAATGELFLDPNAEIYIKTALEKDLDVHILSHGQSIDNQRIDRLLDYGLRKFKFSCDAITDKSYAKIRRGGNLDKILIACKYLRQIKIKHIPEINVEINCTLLSNSFSKKDEFIKFWEDKVDALNFNAEYYDIFKYRNIHFKPKKRVDCNIQTYLLPSGKIAPCCAIMVYSHENDVSWLPHIKDYTLQESHTILSKMYEDGDSELGKLCKKCDWWIMWSRENNRTPYLECYHFEHQKKQGQTKFVALNKIFQKILKRKLFTNIINK